MKYPIMQYTGNESGSTSLWKGLNRTDVCYHGEFSDEENLDTSRYPILSGARGEGETDTEINKSYIMASLPETSGGLCGVVLSEKCVQRKRSETEGFVGAPIIQRIYYEDNKVGREITGVLFETEPVKNFEFLYDGKVKTIGYLNCDDNSQRTALWEVERADCLTADEKTGFYDNLERVKWTLKRLGKRIIINGYDDVTKRGRYYIYDEEKDTLVRSSEQMLVHITGLKSFSDYGYNAITAPHASFSSYIYEGDYFCVTTMYRTGAYFDELYDKDFEENWDKSSKHLDVLPYWSGGGTTITVTSVTEVTETEIKFTAQNSSGRLVWLEWYYNGTTSLNADSIAAIGTHVPPMDSIEAYSGRIWGMSVKENSLFASVYDTPLKMINTDAQLSTAGSVELPLDGVARLTGIAALNSELIVFSSDMLYRVASTGTGFSALGRFGHCGCIDGRSVAEIGGVLYYLGRHGFMEYNGSYPTVISQKLNTRYESAIGLTDGVKYYVSAKIADTERTEYLVYDPRYKIWHKRDERAFESGYNADGKLYVLRSEESASLDGVTENFPNLITRAYIVGGGDLLSWECTSGELIESTLDFKGINELWIMANIPKDGAINVYTAVNGEEMEKRITLRGKGRTSIYKVPVRLSAGDFWKYKLEGSAGSAVLRMERKFNTEGRRHYVY